MNMLKSDSRSVGAKLFLLIICTLSINVCVFGQGLDWVGPVNCSSIAHGVAIAVDDQGNSYATGRFNGTADFDPGVGVFELTAFGGADVFIQKLDAMGNLVWAKQVGGSAYEQGHGIAISPLGDVLITGYFNDTADFDPGPGLSEWVSNGASDIFVLSLDMNGSFNWVAQMGSTGLDQAAAITTDSLGNVYTTGTFRETVDFDPGIGSSNLTASGLDAFIQKLDNDGNFSWAKRIGGTSSDAGIGIHAAGTNDLYVVGSFNQTVDFDPNGGVANETSNGNDDSFLLKLDQAGNYQWVRIVGGGSGDYSDDVTVDQAGNVYFTGRFQNTVDLDPTGGVQNHTSNGEFDFFIEKLSTNGDFIWANGIGGSGWDQATGITVSEQGNVFLSGEFRDTVDFDPGIGFSEHISEGLRDIFVLNLDAAGNHNWSTRFGNFSHDRGFSIAVDPMENIFVTGYFRDTVDFNPGINVDEIVSASTSVDMFILKLKNCISSSSSIEVDACGSYTSPSGQIWTVSNVYEDLISNVTGCDSVITVNLTITNVDTSIAVAGNTLSITNPGTASFQWLNCGTGYSIIGGETGATFMPSVNGSYAVELSENGCVDTSGCHTLVITGAKFIFEPVGLKVYPNPVNSGQYMTAQLSEKLEEIRIEILDMSGRVIFEKDHFNTNQIQLKLDLATGIYRLRVLADDQEFGQKLMIR